MQKRPHPKRLKTFKRFVCYLSSQITMFSSEALQTYQLFTVVLMLTWKNSNISLGLFPNKELFSTTFPSHVKAHFSRTKSSIFVMLSIVQPHMLSRNFSRFIFPLHFRASQTLSTFESIKTTSSSLSKLETPPAIPNKLILFTTTSLMQSTANFSQPTISRLAASLQTS